VGLKSTIAAAVKAGFTALDDVPELVTYFARSATSSYDPATGISTRVETSYLASGIFLSYQKREVDGQQIKPHDQKFLMRQEALAVRPTLSDRLLRSDGKYWEVLSVSEDPAHATWSMQIRGTNG
jgi:hypothetical protein